MTPSNYIQILHITYIIVGILLEDSHNGSNITAFLSYPETVYRFRRITGSMFLIADNRLTIQTYLLSKTWRPRQVYNISLYIW